MRKTLQLAAVPLVEDLGHLVGRHAEHLAHDVVRLGDELHVAVLDAVVHHLDEVPGAARPDVGHARAVVHLRRDGLPDGADLLVRLAVPARHQRRPPQRTLLAARDAGADEVEALCLQSLLAPLRVHEVGVAAVDDDVAGFEEGLDLVDSPIDGVAGLHEQDDLARTFQRLHELLGRVRADELPAPVLLHEGRDAVGLVLARRAVVDGHGVAVALDVARQVLAHHGEADHADVRGLRCLFRCRHCLLSSLLKTSTKPPSRLRRGRPRG